MAQRVLMTASATGWAISGQVLPINNDRQRP
jgi:hypothetical protein